MMQIYWNHADFVYLNTFTIMYVYCMIDIISNQPQIIFLL